MKSLIEEYEITENETKEEQPYLVTIDIDRDLKYNPKYGDDRICKCGHTYDRHFDSFDSYDEMEAVGCKYCRCNTFEEAKPEYLKYFENINKRVQKKSSGKNGNGKVRPFKSTFKINTVKAVIEHPILKIPAYKFYEDDSYVDCRVCVVIPEIDN